jgi:hypothetical protein
MKYLERLRAKEANRKAESALPLQEYDSKKSSALSKTTALEPDPPIRDRVRHITPEMVKSWKIARKWILPRLDELQASGWTRARLFKAGRYTFPYGEWGVAWLDNWRRTEWEVHLENGLITFLTKDISGKKIKQIARPRSIVNERYTA